MKMRSKHGARAPQCIPLIALLLVLGVAPARAGVQVALLPATQTVSPGAEFDVTIEVPVAGSPFNGFNAVVTYDPAALMLMSHQEGCLMTGVCSAACGNTRNLFGAVADSVTISDILLCPDPIGLTGPGQIYKLHFRASNTVQTTNVRFRRTPNFYNAGLFVFPVTPADCAIGIGVALDVGPGPGSAGLRLRAEPNPSSGAVWLTVESALAGEQRLEVVDVQGRTVRRLSQGWYERGIRQVQWDGRDASGARAPAGIYLVTLRAGLQTTRTRVTLLQ